MPLEAAGLKVRPTLRSDASPEDTETIALMRSNLITPMDQAVDLSPAERDRAMAETLKAWEEKGRDEPEPVNPSPVQIRKSRPPWRGLLLIYLLNCGTRGGENEEWRAYDDVYVGYALSFPFSEDAATVTYRVNETYIRNLLDDDDQA